MKILIKKPNQIQLQKLKKKKTEEYEIKNEIPGLNNENIFSFSINDINNNNEINFEQNDI